MVLKCLVGTDEYNLNFWLFWIQNLKFPHYSVWEFWTLITNNVWFQTVSNVSSRLLRVPRYIFGRSNTAAAVIVYTVLQGFFNLVIWTWSRPVPESSDFILPIAQSHTGFQLPTLSLWMPNLKSCKNLNCSGATCSGKTLHSDQQKIQYGALVRPGLSEWWNQVDSACNQSLRAICTVMLLNRLVDNKAEARWLWSINSMGGPHHCRVQGYRYTTSTRVHNASWWIHWKNSCEITLLSTILFTIFFTACMICQMISDINYDQNPFRHFTVMSHELRFTKVFEKSMWKIQWNRIWIDDMTMNSELENEFM